MRLTKRQLKRIIREEYRRLKRKGLISEAAVDYPTGTSFGGSVSIEIDYLDMPTFNLSEFQSYCEEYGGCNVEENLGGEVLVLTGSFDALWEGWVNCCGDEPDEFMARVVAGHENCPSL
tara:strand:+ start:30 stop:386 length:357 start_codon:yes stop_codon:yes gene_type:complete